MNKILICFTFSILIITNAHSEADSKQVGQDCYEKHKGSFNQIEDCINNALSKNSDKNNKTQNKNSALEGNNESKDEPDKKDKPSFQALDSNVNYEGKACIYFTTQTVKSIDQDGNKEYSSPFYVEGSQVAYGKWFYKCENGYWKTLGPTRIYSAKQLELKWAQVLEGTGIAPKDGEF